MFNSSGKPASATLSDRIRAAELHLKGQPLSLRSGPAISTKLNAYTGSQAFQLARRVGKLLPEFRRMASLVSSHIRPWGALGLLLISGCLLLPQALDSRRSRIVPIASEVAPARFIISTPRPADPRFLAVNASHRLKLYAIDPATRRVDSKPVTELDLDSLREPQLKDTERVSHLVVHPTRNVLYEFGPDASGTRLRIHAFSLRQSKLFPLAQPCVLEVGNSFPKSSACALRATIDSQGRFLYLTSIYRSGLGQGSEITYYRLTEGGQIDQASQKTAHLSLPLDQIHWVELLRGDRSDSDLYALAGCSSQPNLHSATLMHLSIREDGQLEELDRTELSNCHGLRAVGPTAVQFSCGVSSDGTIQLDEHGKFQDPIHYSPPFLEVAPGYGLSLPQLGASSLSVIRGSGPISQAVLPVDWTSRMVTDRDRGHGYLVQSSGTSNELLQVAVSPNGKLSYLGAQKLGERDSVNDSSDSVQLIPLH